MYFKLDRIKSIIKSNSNIISNIIGAFFIRGGSLIISLLTIPAYIKYFQNQGVLGLWFTILSVLNWVLMFDLGLGNGLRNKLPVAIAEGDYKKVNQYISSTYISMTLLVVLLSIICIYVIPYISWNNFFNIDSNVISHYTLVKSIKIVFIGIMIQLILKLITSILYAIQKSAIVNFLNLITNILILIIITFIKPINLESSIISMSWVNVIAVNVPLLITTIIIFSKNIENCRPNFKQYNNKYAKEVLKIGSILFWLQIVIMIISATNELLISYLTSPSDVVEYQVYNKIFNLMSSLFALVLIPIWSAITKAQGEKNFLWIKNLTRILYLLAGIAFIFEISLVPFLQLIVDTWLVGSKYIIKIEYAIIIAISNSIFILHNVNTSIGNGMSYFKTQIIWMTFAAVIDIPLAFLLVRLTGGWIGVVLANVISLLPFEILEPIYFNKYLHRQIQDKS